MRRLVRHRFYVHGTTSHIAMVAAGFSTPEQILIGNLRLLNDLTQWFDRAGAAAYRAGRA